MTDTAEMNMEVEYKKHKPHPIWSKMPYMHGQVWTKKINKNKKNACRKHYIEGVEIRELGEDHVLSGEHGLFTTKQFKQCEIIGEYVGEIVDSDVSGEYVAALQNKDWSLGVDAGKGGNEIRFINCYLGIEDGPNVIMQRVYIDTYPHIMIVCLKNLNIGQEILLDYGPSYIEEFLSKKPASVIVKENVKDLPFNHLDNYINELPGFGDDKDSDCDSVEEENEEILNKNENRKELLTSIPIVTLADVLTANAKNAQMDIKVQPIELPTIALADLSLALSSDTDTADTVSLSDGGASETSEF